MSSKPKKIGPYRIEKRLGGGGMGEVYGAYDERLHRRVAIKMVHTDRVSQRSLQRFLNEARMAAKLSHPAIVQIYHVERFEGADCIVMELVEGETLATRLLDGPFAPADALALACELAEGIAAAHQAGILHRDLKPENIMLATSPVADRDTRGAGRSTPGRAKILDFGLARPRWEDEVEYEATPEHTLIGTPGALSPEQVHLYAADHRSDLFAFGTLLYHITTGENPFRGRTALQILNQVCYHHPPPADQVNPEVPGELARLISQLQEKRPEHRPQSAQEVAEVLAELARSLPGTPGSAVLERPAVLHDERRQISMLRYALSPSDPDAPIVSRDVEAFNHLATERIRRRLGRVQSEDDEGLVAFFGFPHTPEDAARRAVSTARELLAACHERFARHRRPMRLRIAVHTGVALMGERPGLERVVFGSDIEELWRLLGSLLGVGESGSVVLSEVTWQLVERDFVCRSIDPREIPPGSRELTAYRVEDRVERRGSGSRSGADTLVGRSRELAFLAERWRLAEEGQGQIVLLCGDPGIGKSRLVWALSEELGLMEAEWLASRCESAFQTSALRPVISLLWQVMGCGRQASAEESLERLREILAAHDLIESEPLLADLLGLSTGDIERSDRRRTFEAVVELILRLAAVQPRLWVIEDLHWMDPSTLEFLTLLFEHVPAAPIALLLTFRPDFRPPWHEPTYLTRLNLASMSPAEVEELARQRAGGQALPATLVAEIIELVDGVPLFVEELTRFVIESRMVVLCEGSYKLSHPEQRLRIPTTLNDALMARLDRLGTGKQVAQFAAVFGRDFPYEALRAVAPLDEETLCTELQRLVSAELLYPRGLTQKCYFFKHALLQKAAYESLPGEQRRKYHAAIARYLEDEGESNTRLHPELLAHHYTEAYDIERAVIYWLRAGRKRHAQVEAVGHLEHGLRLLGKLPESRERHLLEQHYQRALGPALMAYKGAGTPEVRKVYDRLVELDVALEEEPDFEVLWGHWLFYSMVGDWAKAMELARRQENLAERNDDATELAVARRSVGGILLQLGDPTTAHRLLVEGIAIYREDRQHRAFDLVQHPKVSCQSLAAQAAWYLGRSDKALSFAKEAVELAQQLAEPHNVALALSGLAFVLQLRGESEESILAAEQVIELAQRHHFPLALVSGRLFRGAAIAMKDPEGGLAEMRPAFGEWSAIGAVSGRTRILANLAEACLRAEKIDDAFVAVGEGLAIAAAGGESLYKAELLRLKGELLWHNGDIAGADTSFSQAVATALEQGTLAFRLRSATSHGRLHRSQGRTSRARVEVAMAYDAFTEGFETADLRVAAAFLAAEGVDSAQ